ncbi:MAG: 3-methyl-2-oxobutanoate hydroxymethyltransferase [Desulfomicrobium escambiense]|nr:3-methyl-2-oxobutanoate hydroxymethyltransferase [Desulfomicrobium escambiense]
MALTAYDLPYRTDRSTRRGSSDPGRATLSRWPLLGGETTLGASLDVLLAISARCQRGAPGVLVVGDMPFGSYQESCAQAVRNASRFLCRGWGGRSEARGRKPPHGSQSAAPSPNSGIPRDGACRASSTVGANGWRLPCGPP